MKISSPYRLIFVILFIINSLKLNSTELNNDSTQHVKNNIIKQINNCRKGHLFSKIMKTGDKLNKDSVQYIKNNIIKQIDYCRKSYLLGEIIKTGNKINRLNETQGIYCRSFSNLVHQYFLINAKNITESEKDRIWNEYAFYMIPIEKNKQLDINNLNSNSRYLLIVPGHPFVDFDPILILRGYKWLIWSARPESHKNNYIMAPEFETGQ